MYVPFFQSKEIHKSIKAHGLIYYFIGKSTNFKVTSAIGGLTPALICVIMSLHD